MDNIADAKQGSSGRENSAIYSMKLRSRRNPLTDISNTIAQKFTNITQKVISTNKKRKLTVSCVLNELKILMELFSQNEEQETESAHETSLDGVSTTSPSNSSSNGNNLSDLMEMVSNPAFSLPAKKPKTAEEKESEFYGYDVPPRIKRKIPLQHKSADPSQCLEVLDDMYGIYNSLQVIVFFFYLSNYLL